MLKGGLGVGSDRWTFGALGRKFSCSLSLVIYFVYFHSIVRITKDLSSGTNRQEWKELKDREGKKKHKIQQTNYPKGKK